MLIARCREFLTQPVAVGNVQSLCRLESVEEFFGSTRIMAIALKFGDDRELSFDVLPAFGNMPLGEGEMFCNDLAVHDLRSRMVNERSTAR